jgi:hypothetical protein
MSLLIQLRYGLDYENTGKANNKEDVNALPEKDAANMTITFCKIVVLVLTLLSVTAERSFASKWEIVAAGKDSKIFIDNESIQRNGQKVNVWIKFVYDKPHTYHDKSYRVGKYSLVYSCNEQTSNILQIITYADIEESNEVVSDSFADSASDFTKVVPDSIDYQIMKAVCKENSSKKP